ncbi:MAG: MBL fold metallo-hydrolase [Patescibacteria group bacterium]|nr:MBL fold metallo-hydrolase [Patescibacteria group bacterium]
MIITWHGYSCFRIQHSAHEKEVALVTDPFSPEDGNKPPRNLAADIVTVSHDHSRHNNVEAVGGEPFIIDGPGEYEIKEIFVTGVPTFHDLVDGKEKGINTLYYINAGDLHLLHLGDLKHPLDEKHMTEMHDIDVLFVPVGGGDVLNAKQAADVIGQIEPRVVIPMHYKTSGFCPKCDPVETFLKAMGASKTEPLAKFKFSEKDLPQDEMKIVLLEPQ